MAPKIDKHTLGSQINKIRPRRNRRMEQGCFLRLKIGTLCLSAIFPATGGPLPIAVNVKTSSLPGYLHRVTDEPASIPADAAIPSVCRPITTVERRAWNSAKTSRPNLARE